LLAAATQTDYGERVRLVGNQPFLGNWDASKGPSLKWGQGHVWSATLNVPIGVDVDFKVCVGSGAVDLADHNSFTKQCRKQANAHLHLALINKQCSDNIDGFVLPCMCLLCCQIVQTDEGSGACEWESGDNRKFKVCHSKASEVDIRVVDWTLE
jgi:hypothetical protein